MSYRNSTARILQNFQKLPAGLWLFSRMVCLKAPYFRTIRPTFLDLRPGYGRARIRKRWGVTNHIGTVHAIALANLCEFLAGTLMEISIASGMRWIPKGMDIRYLAKATTDVTAVCELERYDWSETQDVPLIVRVYDDREEQVAEATIPMYVSPRRDG
ncbi:MAG: hotdog fold domain-containing protein [Xanthomonadales bacterium]|nr:hotdog fold domain-containing protein [Xanthomonadales bacterium]